MTPQNIDSVKSTIAACVAANCPLFIEGYIDAKGASKDLFVQVIGREGYIELVKASRSVLNSKVIDVPEGIAPSDWLEASTQLEESLTRTLEGLNVPREFVADIEDTGNGYFRNPLKPGVVILRHMMNLETTKCTLTADLLANSRTGVTAAKKYINERLPLSQYLGQLNIEEGRYTSVTGGPKLEVPVTEAEALGGPLPEGNDGNPTVAATTADFQMGGISLVESPDAFPPEVVGDVCDYQALALRTEAPTHGILERILSNPDRYVRLAHSVFGCCSEIGELVESQDDTNTTGELGDLCWFAMDGLCGIGKNLKPAEFYTEQNGYVIMPADDRLKALSSVIASFANHVKADFFFGKPTCKIITPEGPQQVDMNEQLETNLNTILQIVAAISIVSGVPFLTLLRSNIAKLAARYPNKFTQEAALNRDSSKENAAIVSAVK